MGNICRLPNRQLGRVWLARSVLQSRASISRRGKTWNEKSVADILRRAPFYLGNAVYRRGEDIRPGTHEPVITTEQAHLAQRVAACRRRPGRSVLPHRHYILKGLAYCGACGRRLRSETVMRTSRKEYSYYRCPGRRDHTCAAPNIYAHGADRAVIDTSLAVFRHPICRPRA